MPERIKPALLTVDNLHILALPPISFVLEKGQCLAIIGASGIGKSLLLKSIADLVPFRGQLFFKGQKSETMPAPQWRKNICYNAAETGWWLETIGAHFQSQKWAEMQMPAYGLASSLLEKPVAEVSTGQRQRLGLLRAMESNPAVLLLDEPTASLDSGNASLVEKVLLQALKGGTAICMVTHNLQQGRRIGDSVMTLSPDQIKLEQL